MMPIDFKAYKAQVVVPLAKDRNRMDAVASAIRELKSGAGEQALAPVNPAKLFDLSSAADADLAAHFRSIETTLNKWGGNPPSAALLRQLLEAMKVAALDFERAEFWAGQATAQAKARSGHVAAFIEGVKADHPLGVVTPDDLEGLARGAGLSDVPVDELRRAAEAAGMSVEADFEPPAAAVPKVLSSIVSHPEFRTIGDLLVFPDRADKISFIDDLRIGERRLTVADVHAAHHRSETAKDSNAVQQAQKALGLIKSQCSDDAALHQLVAAVLFEQATSIVRQGGTRLQNRDGLIARGIGRTDASRVVSKLQPAGGGSAPSAPSIQILAALAAGSLGEAQRLAQTLPELADDTAERAVAVSKLQEAVSKKETARKEYDRALAARDFATAARALTDAIAIDAGDSDLRMKLEALPPAAPQTPVLRAEGTSVLASWPAVADRNVSYTVVRTDDSVANTPSDGVVVAHSVTAPSAVDTAPPIGRKARYSVFATRDGQQFSDPASAELMITPAPSGLMAVVTDSEVSLTWDMPDEAIAAEIRQETSEGTAQFFTVPQGRTLTVSGLTTGMKYVYLVRAVYVAAGVRVNSDPAQVDATPKGSIAPVADFQVRAVEDPNQHEVEISWTEVAGYRTEIWTFPVAKRSQLSALSTPDHFAAAGGRRIQPLPGGSERGGGVTRRYAIDDGVQIFLPYTFEGNVGVVGPGVVAGSAPTVRECVAEKFGDTVKLSWRWPDGDYLMQVSWHRGGLDRTARVTRAKYRADGGFVISPGDGVTDIGVATVIKSADEEWVSAPVAVAHAQDRMSVSYRLTIKKGMFKAPSVEVRLDPGEYSGPLDCLVVCAAGPFMPTSPADGDVRARERLELRAGRAATLEVALPKLPSPFWVRVFSDGSSSADLVDPPTDQMKG